MIEKLTKEMCEAAYDALFRDLYDLVPYRTPASCHHMCYVVLGKFKELIEEHFDNQPLNWEELKNMNNKPVWDNEEKMWCLVGESYKPLILNVPMSSDAEAIKICDLSNNFRIIGLHCDGVFNFEEFEENRFYRKQVEDEK